MKIPKGSWHIYDTENIIISADVFNANIPLATLFAEFRIMLTEAAFDELEILQRTNITEADVGCLW